LRYKQPDSDTSKLIEMPVKTASLIDNINNTTKKYRFSAAVAGFGQLLRGGKHTEKLDYDAVLALARNSKGNDPFGYRGEFISMVNLAKSLSSSTTQASR
jgi:Ca-activated chloride channel family protein